MLQQGELKKQQTKKSLVRLCPWKALTVRRAVLGRMVAIKSIYIYDLMRLNSQARPRIPVPSGLPGFRHITLTVTL